MDGQRPITEQRLQLILGRLFPARLDWEALFAPEPPPPPVPERFPPPVITGEKPLTAEEISQLRALIQSSETGPLTSAEVDTVHSLIGKDK